MSSYTISHVVAGAGAAVIHWDGVRFEGLKNSFGSRGEVLAVAVLQNLWNVSELRDLNTQEDR